MPKKKNHPREFHLEFGEISDRLRKSMQTIVPDDWEKSTIIVREADPWSDDFLELDTPLHNPDTDEFLGNLPDEMVAAIEELYLLFFPYQRPWETCVISFNRGPSGKRQIRTQFCYAEKA